MATSQLCFSASLITAPLSSSSSNPKRFQERQTLFFVGLTSKNSLLELSNPSGRGKWVRHQAQGGDLLGDFGSRDPFPAEIESGFADKVLGNVDTEHKILIPNISALSLSQQVCSPVYASQPPMSEEDAKKLLKKVIGWRLIEEERSLRLQCLWKLRDFKCGVELINRIYKAVEATGHYPNLHLEQANQVRAELQTASIGGLSMNDFILLFKYHSYTSIWDKCTLSPCCSANSFRVVGTLAFNVTESLIMKKAGCCCNMFGQALFHFLRVLAFGMATKLWKVTCRAQISFT
ncbi:hypothetical protein NE237_028969 [Protea cynaroides]|uniref:4a-hydroxytetrahydrobiopterin dehydratase n=1 Tax=Protea cynaroides TaxID=273540 RepID=A0A9Q0GUD5_9MAGN|nr:hypothetical protein NE237_028969 [Protea cynaroides]